MEWLIAAFVIAALVAMIAARKGRSSIAWFFYALLVFPVALVHVLLIRTRPPRVDSGPRTLAQAEAEIGAKLRQNTAIRHPGDDSL